MIPMINKTAPVQGDKRIFKIGDRVMSKFGEAKITNIEVTDNAGDKYGMKRDMATLDLQAQGRVMIDMDNNHWAYSEQFEVLEPREPNTMEAMVEYASIEFWKEADDRDYSIAIAAHRVNELSSGKFALKVKKEEIIRLYNLMKAAEDEALDWSVSRLSKEQDRINQIHDIYGDEKGYEFEG